MLTRLSIVQHILGTAIFFHSVHRQVAYLALIYAAKYIMLCTTKILQKGSSERKHSCTKCRKKHVRLPYAHKIARGALLWLVTTLTE